MSSSLKLWLATTSKLFSSSSMIRSLCAYDKYFSFQFTPFYSILLSDQHIRL